MIILKKAYPMILTGFVMAIFVVLQIFFSSTNFIKGSIQGFALDTNEKLYIGVRNKILVFAGGEELMELNLKPLIGDNYRFVIQDDLIVVACPKWRTAKTYNLEGSFLFDNDLHFEDVREIAESRNIVYLNGNVYCYERHMGFAPAEILRNGETVYHMSVWDCFFSGVPAACIRSVLLAFFAIALLIFVTDEEVKDYLKIISRL